MRDPADFVERRILCIDGYKIAVLLSNDGLTVFAKDTYGQRPTMFAVHDILVSHSSDIYGPILP